jgi:hypothetical protein
VATKTQGKRLNAKGAHNGKLGKPLIVCQHRNRILPNIRIFYQDAEPQFNAELHGDGAPSTLASRTLCLCRLQ